MSGFFRLPGFQITGGFFLKTVPAGFLLDGLPGFRKNRVKKPEII